MATAVEFDPEVFSKPTSNPYLTLKIAENITLIYNHNLYFGDEYLKNAAATYKTAWATYERGLKRYDPFAYKPTKPTFTDEVFYEDALKERLSHLKGLVVATVASFEEQRRGAQIYKRLGFELAGNSCSWNPNYKQPSSPWHHWLHLFYKVLDGSEKAGKPVEYPNYLGGPLNCCGGYWFVNENTIQKPHSKLRLALYDSDHKPEKRFIPIHQFADYLVGVYPTTHKPRDCPHKFDDSEEDASR